MIRCAVRPRRLSQVMVLTLQAPAVYVGSGRFPSWKIPRLRKHQHGWQDPWSISDDLSTMIDQPGMILLLVVMLTDWLIDWLIRCLIDWLVSYTWTIQYQPYKSTSHTHGGCNHHALSFQAVREHAKCRPPWHQQHEDLVDDGRCGSPGTPMKSIK